MLRNIQSTTGEAILRQLILIRVALRGDGKLITMEASNRARGRALHGITTSRRNGARLGLKRSNSRVGASPRVPELQLEATG